MSRTLHGIPPLPRSKNIQGKGDLLHFLSQKTHAGTPSSLDPPHPRTYQARRNKLPPPLGKIVLRNARQEIGGKFCFFLGGGGGSGRLGSDFFPVLRARLQQDKLFFHYLKKGSRKQCYSVIPKFFFCVSANYLQIRNSYSIGQTN